MKSLKLSNFAGVLLLILFIASVVAFSADQPMAFFNLPGLLIVVGGTVTAMIVSFSPRELSLALKQTRILVDAQNKDLSKEIKQILHFSTLWFRNQAAMIDRDLERLDNAFLKKGLQMVRDKEPAEDVMAHLNWRISQERQKETEVINLFRAMATYAPAFGMVGSLVGLVNMLHTIESGDLSAVSSDMGIALVTTFYGLLLANLIFKPIASKLEQRRHLRVIQLTVLAEGVALIQQQRTPSVIRDILMSFLQDQETSAEPKPSAAFKNKSLVSKLSI
jgi:chemotaxis protein MotA